MIETMNKQRSYDQEASKIVFKVLRSKPRRIYTSGESLDPSELEVPSEVREPSSKKAYEEYERYKESELYKEQKEARE